MSEIHVVIGSGNVGSKLARKLGASGDQVFLITRSTAGAEIPNVTRREADATSSTGLLVASPKAHYVYNCVNPPHYNKWDVEWPPISNAINEYVMKTGAVLITCSNLYGYGPYNGILTEALPLNAQWRNGRVRAEMWLQAMALHDAGKIRATEVRASDYICASDQSRMGDRVVPNLMKGRSIQLLGALDKPHTWTDPDDVAELMRVVARDSRAWGKPWHVPSNDAKTQLQVVEDIANELGVELPKVKSVPPFMERAIGLFNPVIRELSHARYQFNAPFVMSDAKARETFGLGPKPWQKVIKDLVMSYKG